MKSRLQLLAILKYILEESSENSPVGYSEIMDYLFSKGMCPNKNTLTADIKIITQGMAYRTLICLAFSTGLTVGQGNLILSNLDLPTL